MLQTLTQVLSSLISIFGVLVALFAYRLAARKQTDAWFQALNDFHQYFWDDQDLKQVRTWIANDQAYLYLESIIGKRLKGRINLDEDQYSELEKIDKFFNFIQRVYIVSQQLGNQQELWKRLYFQYWILVLSILDR